MLRSVFVHLFKLFYSTSIEEGWKRILIITNQLPVKTLKRILTLVGLFLAILYGLHHLDRAARNGTDTSLISKTPNDYASELTGEESEGKSKTDQPAKFLEYHRGIRTRDGETAPGYAPNQKWLELKKIKQLNSSRAKSSDGRTQTSPSVEFKERGPGNVPGRTRALLNVPGDATESTWLAGSATGGIWRTTNAGATWTEVSSNFPALPISSFGCNTSGSIIYAATGEYVSSVFSALGNGLYKSVDRGVTWTPVSSTQNNPDFSIITRIAVNPSDANIVIATTAKSNLIPSPTSAIMRTTDGGQSWTKVEEVNGVFEQVIATPGNFNVLYASENGVGVWKSTNAGATWSLSNTGMQPEGRLEIAVSPVTPSKIFASAEGSLSGTSADLYYSSNSGATWSLIDMRFNNTAINFMEGQGFYDNTIMCDPFDDTKFYVGGVSLFRTTLTSGSSSVDQFKIVENGTTSFMTLQSFSNMPFDNMRLDVGDQPDDIEVEIRFGPGQSQSAHRFLVPEGATSGVAPANYSYNNYVSIPFEAWDVTNNRQLMVSFRDQNRNGQFDLVAAELQSTNSLAHSREYVYIHDITYAATAHPAIAIAGGQENQMRYNFFPALAPSAAWNPNSLPSSKLVIKNFAIQKLNATTITVADGRGSFDNKNPSDQINLASGVHPDHHFLIPLNVNASTQTYRLLLANDGGVFVSKVSANPGTAQNDWEFKGFGMNTTQFYGADKAPGEQRYIGGSQDNGTRISPNGQTASPITQYAYALGGDGFEVIWHSTDKNKIMGSIYNGQIYRTTNGTTWGSASSGLNPSATEFSFVTKLANSKDLPDRVFTAGTQGVYLSNDFGGQWTLKPISSQFVLTTPFYLDVEVSRANANIVWAGSGMNNSGAGRKIFVSTNGGQSFTATNNFTAVPLGNITKLASHPTQPNTAYALFSFANGPKILRTTNLGQTWEDISGFGTGNSSTTGFPDVAVYCLYVMAHDPNVIWAGTEIGIVESTDNGSTWALRDDFMNVSIWDMKGQDNEIVLATHGRGIWSAIVDQSQQAVAPPSVLASGTSPQEHLMIRVAMESTFDSLDLFIGASKLPTIKDLPGATIDIEVSGVTPGDHDVSIIGYLAGAPHQSVLKKITQIDVLSVQNSYATYFTTLADLIVEGMTLQMFQNASSSDRASLQSNHNYLINKNHSVLIRTPITVSATSPILYYSDIAIVEPGEDSVVVEATENGLDWIPLRDAYDASFVGSGGSWINAFNGQTQGTKAMFVDHEIDISENFNAGTELLFRLRMISGPAVVSWGWAIDYISIQEIPLGTEGSYGAVRSISVYPNPSKETFHVDYQTHEASAVSISVMDALGREVYSKQVGLKAAGAYTESITLDKKHRGIYFVVVATSSGKRAKRILIEN